MRRLMAALLILAVASGVQAQAQESVQALPQEQTQEQEQEQTQEQAREAGADAAVFDPVAHLLDRSHRYSVEWAGISLGKGTIALQGDAGGCYRFESTTDPIALVRWTYGAPREQSRFCVRDGAIVPVTYAYINEKREKDSFRLDFAEDNSEVRMLKRGDLQVREIADQETYDPFLMREVVRLWVLRHLAGVAPAQAAFTMVDDDRIKTYRFAIGEREIVDVPAGRVDALRVDRLDDRRPHHYWLDPERGYIPVKIEQLKEDKVELRMLLLE